MSLGIVAIFGLFMVTVGIIAAWGDHYDTIRTRELNVYKAKSLSYEVKYNAKIKKYFIYITGDNGRSCELYNRLGAIKYYPSSTIATVEMEKLKGNFS